MATCNYNCGDIGDHILIECGEYEQGGQSAVALLECDHTITDFDDPTDWTTAISAGEAIVIKGISAEIPEASPLTTANPVGGGQDITINYDRTVTWVDNNVSANNSAFYTNLMDRKYYVVVYNENSSTIRVYDAKPADFQVTEMAPKTGDALTGYMVTARLRSKPLADIYAAPTGIFA